jgi:hypothetical protein
VPAKKYATVSDLEEFKSEVRLEFNSVRADIASNSLNGLKPALIAIVNERAEKGSHDQAWAMVRADLRRSFHLPRFESFGVKLWAALVGGIGFVIATKFGEWTGLWTALTHGLHLP